MARSNRRSVSKHDANSFIRAAVGRAHAKPQTHTHVSKSGVSYHPHLDEKGRGPRSDMLRVAAHHGVTAHTHHGPGGLKPHQMKIGKTGGPKSGLHASHKNGVVKIPRIHSPGPGKGLHNHIRKPKI